MSVRKTQSSVRTHCVEIRLLGRLILGIIRLIIQCTLVFVIFRAFKVHSHRANAKKIKEQLEESEEKNSNIKENIRFRVRCR